ncbi:hypothetical protein AXYL_01621 [Achromobacter xylosoxidans A8]|uniref:Uncharacterized protein n=1 Tax=Achromobacter xylosoxidans (strain A8) TaxID=762376 RepID=E3HUJ6_ACHXA|nr:hypothetical protein AXYL_01621 [Achromobacter xylosoxidans A8]
MLRVSLLMVSPRPVWEHHRTKVLPIRTGHLHKFRVNPYNSGYP